MNLLQIIRSKYVILFLILLIVSQSSDCTSSDEPYTNEGDAWECIWSDECDGANNSSPDSSKWGYEIGYIRNNELQYYTDRTDNVRYNGEGQLIIETKREKYDNYDYTSGSITTKGKFSFKYGKIVIVAKLPSGKGIWPAFWMLGDKGKWPGNGEIDIMELCGGGKGFDNVIHMTVHYSSWYWWHEKDMTKYELPIGNFCDDYHTFEVEWNSKNILWRIDGELKKVFDITSDDKSEFRQAHYIKINNSIGGSWPTNVNKKPDESTPLPQYLIIQSIKVYQLKL